jgi:hypothetical protein
MTDPSQESVRKNGVTMRRIIYGWLAACILAGAMVSLSVAQTSAVSETDASANPQSTPLGDYARTLKKEKKPEAAKQWDNDNLPRQDKLSVVGAATSDSPASSADATQQQAGANAATEAPKMMPGQTAEERQKVVDQWQQKLEQQRAQIDSLSQALDLQQREYRVHAAEYYNDPSARMTTTQWGKDDTDYKQKIAAEQKAIEDAKQKFSDMEEEARHSGVPNSVSDAVEHPEATATQPETSESSEGSSQSSENSSEPESAPAQP